MTENAKSAGSSFFTIWVIPIVLVVAFAAGVALLMSRFGDWSFPFAFVAILILLLGTAGYFLGMFYWYETTAKRLGWQCRTGPQVRPDGTMDASDIEIHGELRGRAFTLRREKSTSPGRRVSFSSVVEWKGDDIRVPDFSLNVTGAFDAGIDRLVGASAMIHKVAGALGAHVGAPCIELDTESKLARRAELSAPDAAAALAFFSPMRCDALDALVVAGSIHGEPGRIVIGGTGFPLPWKLEEFLAHADEIRSVIAG